MFFLHKISTTSEHPQPSTTLSTVQTSAITRHIQTFVADTNTNSLSLPLHRNVRIQARTKESYNDKERRAGGIWGHFSHKIQLEIVGSSNGSKALDTVFPHIRAHREGLRPPDTPTSPLFRGIIAPSLSPSPFITE